MDFMKISTRSVKQGVTEIFPKFILKKSSDLMIRGGDFYAVWREDLGLWSTEEQDVIDMVDRELYNFTEERRKTATDSLVTKYMWDSDSGSIDSWHKYCQKRMRDNFHPLDEKIIFGDTETTKTDYASKKLSYPLRECDISGYEKLISTLYTPEERHKIEWAIGSIIEGDSKYIQKFLVLYGSAGTGKSTILNIIQRLFEGYYSVFDAKALGSSSNSFALEAFKSNPMVAIQHDGDLSRIEDNTRLNSLVSHELMTVNEKFKSTYANKFNAFLFMGTNKPVKITDSKSGLLRRLIDVMPSGKKLDQKDYNDCIDKIPFELPGIAYHCHQVYLKNKDAYDDYVPTLMMGATNDFYACMMGYTPLEIYDLSQKIINSSKGESRKFLFGEAYNISYTDIYDFASAGNKKSLKKLEIEMGIHHQELGLPWDKPVPEELWQKVAEYCDNDVLATEAAWNYLQSDWLAREILADLAGLTVNDTTNTLTTKFIFGNNKNPQNEFNYRNLAEPVFEMDEETRDFLEEACPEMMSQTHGEAGSLLPYFPGYKYENGVSTYRGEEVGEGGYVYAEPGMYGNVALLDIASMHPHSTIAECLFGVRYTKAYRDIVEGRVSIKHEAWDEVDKMLDGKLKPYIQRVKDGELTSKDLANALKTAINSVYGLTSATFSNPFHDVRNKDNIVAKRGALFMVDLKHEVQKRGFTVAHIKTDSIKIPDATPEIIKFVMDFGKKYGYTFEHEATYDRMCLVNNAVYIAKYKDPEGYEALYGYAPGDNRKHKNDPWTATGKQFAVPYVFKTCFSKEPTTINDMRETFSVKSALYLDMNEKLPDVSEYEKRLEKLESDYKKGKISDTTFEPEAAVLQEQINDGHNRQFVGKVGEFCPIKPGCGGGLLVREQNGKFYAATGTTGYRWLESEQFLKKADEDVEVIDPETGEKKKIAGAEIINGNNDDIIDRSYYDNLVNDAIEAISKYGDYEWFVSDDPYIAKEKPLPDFMNIPDGYEEEIPFA